MLTRDESLFSNGFLNGFIIFINYYCASDDVVVVVAGVVDVVARVGVAGVVP